jgi:lysozyme family protein
MTASNFAPSLNLTLVYEGGWSDNPRDPGGATMRGVTQAVYDDDRDQRGLPRRSVKLITDAELQAIYRWRYWDLVRADDLPAGADYAVFDFAVNSGVSRASKVLQSIVGSVQDGHVGSVTIASALRYKASYGPTALSDAMCNARMSFLRSLPTFVDFGNGWTRRVLGSKPGPQMDDTGVIDRAYAMAMSRATTAPSSPLATVKTYNAAALVA